MTRRYSTSVGRTVSVRTVSVRTVSGGAVSGGARDAGPVDAPSEFRWRGRRYLVREVLSCWVEADPWWSRRSDSLGLQRLTGDRTVWRVEAQPVLRTIARAQAEPSLGVYDLVFEPAVSRHSAGLGDDSSGSPETLAAHRAGDNSRGSVGPLLHDGEHVEHQACFAVAGSPSGSSESSFAPSGRWRMARAVD